MEFRSITQLGAIIYINKYKNLINSRYSTLPVHTETILLPERTLTVEVGAKVLEKGGLYKLRQRRMQGLVDRLYRLEVT